MSGRDARSPKIAPALKIALLSQDRPRSPRIARARQNSAPVSLCGVDRVAFSKPVVL